MRGQPGDHTLQATALISEVYLRLNCAGSSLREDRTRLLATAATAMRQVLVDHARKRGRQKNKPPGERTPLDQVVVEFEQHAIDLEALDTALRRLSDQDPESARAVELRFFGGMSVEETADSLGMTKRTFERHWTLTRTWLHEEIK